MPPTSLITLSLVLTLTLLTVPAAAQEQYFVTVFGSGQYPLRARRTHTFATFTRLTPAPAGLAVENHTISWMPATLRIRPLALRPEPGVNLTQEQSLAWAERMGIRTSVWGPFNISAERFTALMDRKAELESGQIRYRALGGFTKNSNVSNCGQSFPRAGLVGEIFLQPTPAPGEFGTRLLVERGLETAPYPVYEWPQVLPLVLSSSHPVVHRRPGDRIFRFRQ